MKASTVNDELPLNQPSQVIFEDTTTMQAHVLSHTQDHQAQAWNQFTLNVLLYFMMDLFSDTDFLC